MKKLKVKYIKIKFHPVKGQDESQILQDVTAVEKLLWDKGYNFEKIIKTKRVEESNEPKQV